VLQAIQRSADRAGGRKQRCDDDRNIAGGKMSNRFILSLVIAFVAAVLLTKGTDQRPFEEIVERAVIADGASAPGSRCPLSRETIEKADVVVLRACIAHGLYAFEAARRYPIQAPKVFAVYGEEEVFWQVLDKYGHEVIPVIASYVEDGSLELQIRHTARNAWNRLWAGQSPKWEHLTREQIGLLAIHRLAARGHEMFAEFEIVDGVAKRKPVASVFFGAKEFLFGDLGNLESVLVRGERLPTWDEVGFAVLDATIVLGGVKSFAKVARAGGGAAVEKSTGRLVVEGAFEGVTTVGRVGKRVAPLAFAYVAITHPGLIASFGGWIAEQFGFSGIVGIFAVYFCGLLAVWWLLAPLIWCGRLLCNFCRFVVLSLRVLRPRGYTEAVPRAT
jgi:hypothetical protein